MTTAKKCMMKILAEKIIEYRLAVIGLTLILALSAFVPSDDPSSQLLLCSFRKQCNEWMDAFNGRDVEKLVQFYSRDVLYISPEAEQPLTIGRDRLIASLQEDIDKNEFIDTLEITSVCVTHDHAALICRFRAVSERLPHTGSSLLMLKKAGDSWKITVYMTICRKNFTVL